ncbi:MAG: Ig-like domain-containing protein, partial [Coriobacteriales bacterium]|nr:Ig-like domain-containing protein [Coriobacteriales bacterium]
ASTANADAADDADDAATNAAATLAVADATTAPSWLRPNEAPEAPEALEVPTVGLPTRAYLGWLDTTGDLAKPAFDSNWETNHLDDNYVSPQLTIDAAGDTLQLTARFLWSAFTPASPEPPGDEPADGDDSPGEEPSDGDDDEPSDGDDDEPSDGDDSSDDGDPEGDSPDDQIFVPRAPEIGESACVQDTDYTAVIEGKDQNSIFYSSWDPTAENSNQSLPSAPDWKSSNPLAATVDSSGKVTGIGPGITRITVTWPPGFSAAEGPLIATIDIKVGTFIDNSIYAVQIGTVDAHGEFTMATSLAISTQGGTISLVARALRKDGTSTLYTNNYAETPLGWTSSNTTVAEITPGNNLLRAKANGESRIRVWLTQVSGINNEVTLTVSNQTAGSITDPRAISRLYLGDYPFMGALPVYTSGSNFSDPRILTRGGTLDLQAAAYTEAGSGVQLLSDTLNYTSSDSAVAEVHPLTGRVTAKGDGTATITAWVAVKPSVTATITVRVYGQNELGLPTRIDVTDADRRPYGDKGVLFDKSDGQLRLYALVTYSSGQTRFSGSDALDGLIWSVSNTDMAYIESQSGYFVARDDGIVKVSVRMPNGIGDGWLFGTVWVTSDTGKYGSDDPGGSGTTPAQFTVQVLFEDDPSETVYKELTWQFSELVAMSTSRSSYTFIQSHDTDTNRIHYYQSNARGVPFITFTDALEVKPEDIQIFRIFPVGSQAGQYAGGMTVSYDYLFGHSRYFFSLIARDGSIIGGAQQVYPMLATSYSWYSLYSDDASTSFVPGDYSALNPCSRLMFGSTSTKDVNASRSIHSVEKIVIYLKGKPPVHFDSNDNTSGYKDDGSSGGNGGGGSGTGSGSGSGNGTGDGNGDGDGDGDGNGAGNGDEDGMLAAGALGEGRRSNGGGGGSGGSDGAGAGGLSGGWHVYQMMNQLATELPVIMAENPYARLLLPAAGLVIIGGAVTMLTRFRLQRRLPANRAAVPQGPRGT